MTEHDAIEARPPIPPGTVAWSEADALDRRLPAGAGDPAAGIAGPPPFLSVGARRWQYGSHRRDGVLLAGLSLLVVLLAGAATLEFDRPSDAWVAKDDRAPLPAGQVPVVETRVIAIERAPSAPVALATKRGTTAAN